VFTFRRDAAVGPAVGEYRQPSALGLREVAAEEEHVALSDAAEQHRALIVHGRRDPAGFDIRAVGGIEVGLQAPDTSQAHPGADSVGDLHPVMSDANHGIEGVFGLFEVGFLLEVQRVSE